MAARERLRIAVQKSGRLNEKSLSLLGQCGLNFDVQRGRERLLYQSADFPIDLMLVRDDDIPEYVADGVCDLGVVGLNVLEERFPNKNAVAVLRELGFGRCRLAIAVPNAARFTGPKSLSGLRVATSYPIILKRFLQKNKVKAQIVELSGSVEIAPSLEVADAVCDLVSTGATLTSNGLKEVLPILQSQALLISGRRASATARAQTERLLQRIDGVLQAVDAKYVMMNAPRSALPDIQRIIPGMESPSVIPLGGPGDKVAVHAVARENVFWETIEKLKGVGATSILVLNIEKIVA
jgi:ATP phosphoribosyltransferase